MPSLELESQILHKLMNINKWVSTLFLFPRKFDFAAPKKKNNNAGILRQKKKKKKGGKFRAMISVFRTTAEMKIV